MYRLVIDSSALVPCGNKSEEDIESIKKFGDCLPKVVERSKLLLVLTQSILDEYLTRTKKEMERCKGNLPRFHAGIYRSFTFLARQRRLKKCVTKDLSKELGLKVHILETSRVEAYEVSEFIDDENDEKFVKAALAVASGGEVYIVTVDSHLLALAEEWNYKRFCRRFEYGRNVKVVKPGTFVDMIR